MPPESGTTVTPDSAPAGSSTPGTAPTKRKVKVAGQIVEIDPKDEDQLLSAGIRFTQNQQAFAEEKRALYEEVQPVLELTRKIKGDPRKQAIVNAVLADEDLESFIQGDQDDKTDDPTLKEIRGMKRMFEGTINSLRSELAGLRDTTVSMSRDTHMTREEQALRSNYKWAKDDQIESARSYARKHNLNLTAAFKLVTFDDAQEIAREETLSEFDIDPNRFSGPSTPVIDGIGPLNDQVMERLYEDPDAYAKHRQQLRDWRRARRGG